MDSSTTAFYEALADDYHLIFEDWQATVVQQGKVLLILKNAGNDWQVQHYTAEYRALRRQELALSLESVGFSAVQWHFPADSGYYQPIVTAHKR